MEKNASIETFIKDQIEKWKNQTRTHIPVITISSEPGSGGRVIAQGLAKRLGIDLFDRNIVKEIAESARISGAVIETMEKDRLSGIKDFISSLVNDRYLWPGVYLDHLMKVVAAIASHGNAIIVGRGANFLIPAEDRLSIRVISPLDTRVNNVAKEFGVTREEAKRRVINRENRRSAFIRQSFNADVADPRNYDLVVNTQKLDMDASLGAVIGMVVGSKDTVVTKPAASNTKKK
ncbi:cytidylate kinase-like family protein [Desulfosarcina sp.]|uniref:cytidylate kinase-like family protein n=1 Tax=Desulfosarcina sp. TaxID=2027861 RepID=UPI0029B73E8A|nr:cytidylate kinase-like family protein [Desulfosarcina sp.]MDX2451718.1 cytidylate kinase-like family protein [Desulfosarcina sp.]MDX2489505.1 cytidylate kinase-like family protein [Desulfosarcina sp.]